MINKGSLNGIVVTKSGDKTYNVEISYTKAHPKYRKIVSYKKRFLAHSEKEIEVGAAVTIAPSGRRLSARKHYVIV